MLDIRVPVREDIVLEKDLIIAFYNLTPKLLTHVLSFMTLGLFWTAHTTQFSFIDKSDRNFNWLNLSFLFFVTITPFTTAFLSEYITFRFAVAIYWINLFLLGFMLVRMFDHADKHKLLKSDIANVAEIKSALMHRGIVAQALYAFGALLCLVSTYLSIAVLTMIQFFFVLALFSGAHSKVVLKK